MCVQFDGKGKVSISRRNMEIKEEEIERRGEKGRGNNFADVIVWRREIISNQWREIW